MSDVKFETTNCKLDTKSKGNYRTSSKPLGGVQQQQGTRVLGRRYRSYSATMNRPIHHVECSGGGDKSPTENPTPTRKFSQPSLNNNNNSYDRLKRRHGSFNVGCGVSGFKRRKKEAPVIVPPTKFLLGGNITDPLNLNSFVDEKPGSRQQTPNASPRLPVPKQRSQVEVLIPANINDPLNLNGCTNEDADLDDSIILTPVKAKRRKRKNSKVKKRSLQGLGAAATVDSATAAVVDKLNVQSSDVSTETKLPGSLDQIRLGADGVDRDVAATTKTEPLLPPPPAQPPKHKKSDNKIVSPAIPQPGSTTTRKHRPSGHSRLAIGGREPNVPDVQRRRTAGAEKQDPRNVTFNAKNARFRYGNYNRYYGYRNPDGVDDYRLKCFQREWFAGLDVLDVGCNIGHITLSIARDLAPRKIVGIDIDASLVRIARRNVVHYLPSSATTGCDTRFPISLAICCGPIAMAAVPAHSAHDQQPTFPNNVCFVEGNYVLESEELLEVQRPEFDTVICLSLTKWVHLNWGDAGLKRLFKRVFRQLRPGGRFILEAQAFTSYGKKKKLAPEILENFQRIKFMPEQFTEYLLSKEVGFSKCEVIDTPFNASKGFRRPIQLFTKGGNTPTRSSPSSSLSSTRKNDEVLP